MTYDHMVKVNGKWYGAGDEVTPTLPASVATKTVEPKTEKKEVVEEVKKPETTTKRSNNKGNKK